MSSNSNRMSTHSPASSTTSASPASLDNAHQTLSEVSETMTRIVNDIERSSRLFQQAKQSILNLGMLQEHYPKVASLCLANMTNERWSAIDQGQLAKRLNPSAGLESKPNTVTSLNGWVWPIDQSTPFPLLVNFGRAVLREAAQEAKVVFVMEPVRLP
jgi:hypothetical protein